MFELTIENEVYQFNAGMGFVKEINKTVQIPVDGAPSVKQNAGVRYKIGQLLDGDVEALVDVLDVANKGQSLRATRTLLEKYIEDESTDIDKLFEDVLDFLSNANCTKKAVRELREVAEKRMEQMQS
ncbi:MAG: tail assembly chaperone [Butyricicoccus sp.]|nr:tail assembly chaperone [Butyricicoccus sp.]